MKTIVLLSSLPVDKDSRLFKQAASFSRLGFRSIVVEKYRSQLNPSALPFELISLEEQRKEGIQPTGNQGLKSTLKKWAKTILPNPLKEWIGLLLYLFQLGFSTLKFRHKIPRASLYCLHYYELFPVAYWLSKKYRVPLMYDAHDFYAEVHLDFDPKQYPAFWPKAIPFLTFLEKICIKKAAAIVTVCKGVAELYQTHNQCLPHVITNCHDLRMDVPLKNDMKATLGLSEKDFLVVCVGQAKSGMAIVATLKALHQIPVKIHLAFLGRGYHEALASYGDLYHSVREQIHIFEPVHPSEIVPFISSADVALILYYSRNCDYQHCLPNRFFQSFSAGLPMLYPDLSEIRRIAEKYNLGICIDPQDLSSVSHGLLSLYENPQQRDIYRQNARRARSEVNWENEEKKLGEIVQNLIHV